MLEGAANGEGAEGADPTLYCRVHRIDIAAKTPA